MSPAPPSERHTELDDSAEPARDPFTGAGHIGHDAARIGRYCILERIGAGGMGEVYAAYDEQLDRKVAVKVLHRERGTSETAQARLHREAQALARLSHPNVVAVYEAGMHEGEVFLAMEFVRGRTLRTWLRERPHTWGEILETFVAAGEGLWAMHELGLVHRDFKPDNALVDGHERIRLIDFGLAQHSQRRAHDDDPIELTPRPDESLALPRLASLTRTGAMVGTPMYMAPEQFERKPASTASDQFGFCVALYEALYGISPFEGNTAATRGAAVLHGELVPPPSGTAVPSAVLAVVTRGLRRDPAERWPDMRQLLAALRGLLASYEPDLQDVSSNRSRGRILIAFAVLGALALLTFGVLTFTGAIAFTPASLTVVQGAILALTGGAAFVTRTRWLGHRTSRRVVAFLLLMLTLYFVQNLVGWIVGRSAYHTYVGISVSTVLISLFATPLLVNSLWWCALWVAACTVLMLVDPPRYFAYFLVATFGAAIIGARMAPRRSVDRWIRHAASQGSNTSQTGLRSSPPVRRHG
ncbi:serine/threonine-protein kinase [Paraliomyxa miuraensis]|uniref:serine/threonine-protein kinase n=1 Tax=Paraliomyxa miuraensis TaxID=376150 RepID=UPI002255FBBC|nr:protein kinase [Paraliomyxa miuraensis]MCX4243565.1 protein kinase [Paraliomyxa miuraensis]